MLLGGCYRWFTAGQSKSQYMLVSGGGESKAGSAVNITYQAPSIEWSSGAHKSVDQSCPTGGWYRSLTSALFQSLKVPVSTRKEFLLRVARQNLAPQQRYIGARGISKVVIVAISDHPSTFRQPKTSSHLKRANSRISTNWVQNRIRVSSRRVLRYRSWNQSSEQGTCDWEPHLCFGCRGSTRRKIPKVGDLNPYLLRSRFLECTKLLGYW